MYQIISTLSVTNNLYAESIKYSHYAEYNK